MTATQKALALVKQARIEIKTSDDQRDAGLPLTIPEVERFDNIAYGPANPGHLLDIYLPKQRTNLLPIIINIHGGGWFYGTKETYQFYGMSLAKQGFGVVNFNYRLPPEAEFPDELADVDRAFHWVANHAIDYHLDTQNVFVVGDSAGGQMALQYLAVLTNATYRQLFGYQQPKLKIRAAALNCSATFIDQLGFLGPTERAYFTDDALQKHGDLMHTEQYLTTALPPLFLMTANQDFIRDCTVRLDGFLIAKQIDHEFHSYGTEAEPRHHVFHCNIKDNLAQQCNQDELDFFKRYLVK